MYKTSTQESVKHHWRKLKNVVFPPTPRPHAFHVCGSTEYIVSWELSGQEGIAEETGHQLMYSCVVLVIIFRVTNHPTLCGLKQHSVACRSAVWAGLSRDSSSLLHVVSAGVAGQGAGKFQGDSDTWQLSWCWVLAESSTKVCASLCAAWTLFWSGSWAPRERVFYRVEVHGICYDLASNITLLLGPHRVDPGSHKVPPVSRGDTARFQKNMWGKRCFCGQLRKWNLPHRPWSVSWSCSFIIGIWAEGWLDLTWDVFCLLILPFFICGLWYHRYDFVPGLKHRGNCICICGPMKFECQQIIEYHQMLGSFGFWCGPVQLPDLGRFA